MCTQQFEFQPNIIKIIHEVMKITATFFVLSVCFAVSCAGIYPRSFEDMKEEVKRIALNDMYPHSGIQTADAQSTPTDAQQLYKCATNTCPTGKIIIILCRVDLDCGGVYSRLWEVNSN